jgi:hypothetical protein
VTLKSGRESFGDRVPLTVVHRSTVNQAQDETSQMKRETVQSLLVNER